MHRFLILLPLILITATLLAQQERTRYFPKKTDRPKKIPAKKDVWIFIMAGQSNMAGRGIVEPQDTIPNERILTINANNEVVVAKEPLHFYEPNLTGLGCGLSFARELIKNVDKSISILLVPTAVGGSSTFQWLGDSLHRNVKLLSNFKERVQAVKKYGTIKGILWHQGESDTGEPYIPGYQERLQQLFTKFRNDIGDLGLPILIGELGSYSENQANWARINKAIHNYAEGDKHAFVINTQDLHAKEDNIHFDSPGQRMLGLRMARKFLEVLRR